MDIKKIVIEIETNNSAFEDFGNEVSGVLQKATDRFNNEEYPRKLLDSNGNVVGDIKYRFDEE